MRSHGFPAGKVSFVFVVGAALSGACSPDTGKAGPSSPFTPVDAGHVGQVTVPHPDAGIITGIKAPPDAAIIHPGEGGISVGTLSGAKRIDLLFMLDDSRSMGDKHEVLKAAIPDLLNRFVNPVCIDRFGHTSQPATADAACPDEQNRQFSPVRDIHIGIITSSLGSPDVPGAVCSPTLGVGNDGAHLIGALPRGAAIPTSAQGFLAWDPDQKATPPGQKDLGTLVDSFRAQVDTVGEAGCGLESQLEAWYRFLADPEPRQATRLFPCGGVDAGPTGPRCPKPDGIDQTVLDERAAFLRPDSLLVIVMLTDENDCSIDDGSVMLASTSAPAPRGSAACATKPSDPCCYPCTSVAPTGCPSPDSACAVSKTLTSAEDQPNLRCFNGKQRFGLDPLFPVQRYVDALTKPMVSNRAGGMVQNPIFAGGQRSAGDVFLVGIVGVPWQDVATDETLKSPTDLKLKSVGELRSGGGWDVILGDPTAPTPPRDPLLVESETPRAGQDPITGDALAPPTAGLLANPINGHERVVVSRDDLQYSCIFPLPMAKDCTLDPAAECACRNPLDGTMDPLCQGTDGMYGTTQRFAKAYPPLRELQVIKGIGDTGVVASICPKNATDPGSESYAYRPVIGTLVQDVAPKLIR